MALNPRGKQHPVWEGKGTNLGFANFLAESSGNHQI